MEQDYTSIDLRELLGLLRRNMLALLVCTLWGALAAFVVCLFVLPTRYQAAATLVVNADQEAVTGDQHATARQLVGTYAVLLTNDSLLGEVIREHGLADTVGELRERVSAQAVDSTPVLRITVQDEDPAIALAMLTTMVERAPDVLAGAVQTGTVEVVSPPWVDAKPVAPHLARNIVLGAGLGLVLCVAVVMARHLLAGAFGSEEDVERRLGLPVLASAPAVEVRRGTSLADAAGYREAFPYLKATLRDLPQQSACRCLLVTSAMPGEGKSAVAAGLARSLSTEGRVLLLDADLGGEGLPEETPRNGLADVLAGSFSFTECVQHLPLEGYWLLPAAGPVQNPAELLDSPGMANLMTLLESRFDHIVIDTGPVLATADAAVLACHADGVLMVVRCKKGVSQRQAQRALHRLRAAGAVVAGAVLNSSDAKEMKRGRSIARKFGVNKY